MALTVSDLRDFLVKLFGAVGDGVADDTAAIVAAEAQGETYSPPSGTYQTTKANYNSFSGSFFGLGRLKDSAGRYMPEWFARIDSAPAEGTEASFLTAFNGDTKMPFSKRGMVVTGAATLGQPTTGYGSNMSTCMEYSWTEFTSGYQHSKTNGAGRTGYYQFRHVANHKGAGDYNTYVPVIQVYGNGDATVAHWLAQPAGAIYNGTAQAQANNVGINTGEMSIIGGAYDVRGRGPHYVLDRNVATGANEQFWEGMRLTSKGTAGVDVGINLVDGYGGGGFDVGFSTALATIGTGAAYAMAAEQRIEFKASYTLDSAGIRRYPNVLGGWTLGYENADPSFVFRAGGSTVFRIKQNGTLNASLLATHANDAAAGTGGLVQGDFYKTSTGELRVKL